MTLAIIENFNAQSSLDTLVSLLLAFILGSLIGFERQYRQRTAGLRTNVLVCLGAAIFVDIANRIFQIVGGNYSAIQVVAYVVSGVGFLGAGVIMREEGNVRGINTAATLWCSAAIGAAVGADLVFEAVLGTMFILAANTLLRPIVNAVNKQPYDLNAVELSTMVSIIVDKEEQKTALQMVNSQLQQRQLAFQHIDIHAFGDEEVEIELLLVGKSIEQATLDGLVHELLKKPMIQQAFLTHQLKE